MTPPDNLERAVRAVRTNWSPARAQAAADRLHRGIVRQRRIRRGVRVGVPAVTVLLAFAYSAVRPTDAPVATQAPPVPPPLMALPDQSTVSAESSDVEVRPLRVDPLEIQLVLERGRARFDVSKRPQRRFVVRAGGIEVLVVGTSFSVARLPAGVKVDVHEGVVRVQFPSGETRLGADQSQLFSDGEPVPPAAMAVAPPDRREDLVAPAVPGRPHASWRALARSHRYERAFRALTSQGESAVRDDAEDLMLAADVARLSRHPEQALRPLRHLLARHAGDSRAPLAAFTLGKIYLDDLSRSAEAAEMFAFARTLAPHGFLAEDALAREAHALVRAGAADKARKRAAEYLQLFPRGRRVTEMRALSTRR